MPKNLDDCSELIVFRWNRDYPSDLKFDFDFSDSFELSSAKIIKGNISKEQAEKSINICRFESI